MLDTMAVKPYNGGAKEAVPLFTEDEKRFFDALEEYIQLLKYWVRAA